MKKPEIPEKQVPRVVFKQLDSLSEAIGET